MSRVTIGICMGSSCFSRGNGRLAAALQEAVTDGRLFDRVALEGFLCIDQCGDGPCVRIDGEPCAARAPHEIIERAKEKVENSG